MEVASIYKRLCFSAALLVGNTENELNDLLYNKSLGTPINLPVIWVIFKPEVSIFFILILKEH